MKTRAIFVIALVATVPFVTLGGCTSDDSQTQDSGPQNNPDAAKDVAQQNDTGPGPGTDSGTDAPNACSTGIAFDNSKVPGYPNNIPQP